MKTTSTWLNLKKFGQYVRNNITEYSLIAGSLSLYRYGNQQRSSFNNKRKRSTTIQFAHSLIKCAIGVGLQANGSG